MSKTLSAFVLGFFVFFPLSAPAAELVYWSPQAVEHPSTLALKGFVARLQNVDTSFDSARLLSQKDGGSQSQLIKAVQQGAIGVAVMNAGTVERVAAEARVLALPFLFRDSRQLFAQLDGQVGQSIEQTLAAKGLILLGWFDGGSRSFYMRDKPQSIADFQAAKVRIPNRTDLKSLVSTLGGTPTPLAYDQVNAALDDGSIDGAENDMLSYEADQHYKHARYFVTNSHFVQFEALVVSAEVWKRLPDDARSALQAAGRSAAQADREMWTKRVQQARARLEKEGVKFVEAPGNVVNSRVATLYKPYLDNPATSALLVRLMTSRS